MCALNELISISFQTGRVFTGTKTPWPPPLAELRHRQGRLFGQMEALGFNFSKEAVLQTLTADVLKSSEIEGEKLDADQVRSSIARRLGMDVGGLKPADRDVEGVVEMMLDATQHLRPAAHGRAPVRVACGAVPDRAQRHAQDHRRRVARRRHGPMQVVSGRSGQESVHFEAPAAPRLDEEMAAFLEWFNGDADRRMPVLKAGLAHFWFVTIHPFDDGNGRIARAIADMALARSEDSPQRFYSMSAQIRQERNAYYDILERRRRDDGHHALDGLVSRLPGARHRRRRPRWPPCSQGAVLGAATRSVSLNDRQRCVLNRLLDGFEGKLTTSKWATLAKCSQDTALRDIQDLVERGILKKDAGGGRSTSYSLAEN